MQLLVIIIDKNQHLRPILDRFYEENIGGATVIDSMGMGHLLAEHVSLFARFADLTGDSEQDNKTVFTLIEDEKTLDQAIHIVEEVIGDMEKPETGMWFVLPVSRAKGFSSILKA